MLAQHVHHHRRQRHGALACFRLEAADGVEVVGALAHVELAALQIDVDPAQPAQLGCAQAGEDRGQQQRPPASVERGDDGADFVGRGDVDADLELALPLVGARFLASAMRAQGAHDVLSDKAALLGVGQDGTERAAHLAHHGRRAVLAQRVLERAHHRDGQLRELHRADQRDDVQVDVLPVGGERGALEPGGLAACRARAARLRRP